MTWLAEYMCSYSEGGRDEEIGEGEEEGEERGGGDGNSGGGGGIMKKRSSVRRSAGAAAGRSAGDGDIGVEAELGACRERCKELEWKLTRANTSLEHQVKAGPSTAVPQPFHNRSTTVPQPFHDRPTTIPHVLWTRFKPAFHGCNA
jgi:hypothetical protein